MVTTSRARLEALPLDSSALELHLERLLPPAAAEPCLLHCAMRYAVFSGGKRLRPRLLLAVFGACLPRPGDAEVTLAMHAACAIELIHTASLVHDDLPIFDDADERRGRATVHRVFGDEIALLTGDALLTLAFELLADTPSELASTALAIQRLLGRYTGSRHGIIGGQSLECATGTGSVDLDRYHDLKTAALFRLATQAGAVAAGVPDADAWGLVGRSFGLAFQLADDLYDTGGTRAREGKPTHQDARMGRPNASVRGGEAQTRARMLALLDDAIREATGLVRCQLPEIFEDLVHRTVSLGGRDEQEGTRA